MSRVSETRCGWALECRDAIRLISSVESLDSLRFKTGHSVVVIERVSRCKNMYIHINKHIRSNAFRRSGPQPWCQRIGPRRNAAVLNTSYTTCMRFANLLSHLDSYKGSKNSLDIFIQIYTTRCVYFSSRPMDNTLGSSCAGRSQSGWFFYKWWYSLATSNVNIYYCIRKQRVNSRTDYDGPTFY